MNLRQLEYFMAVAQHHSFLKASKALHVSQPSISAQIRVLEQELEVQLFERRSSGTVLTPGGAELLEHARAIFATLEQARNGMRAYQTADSGCVAVGIPGSLASTLTVPLVQRVQEAMPNVQLRVAAGLSGHVQRWIREGTLDFGLIYANAPIMDLDLQPLLSEELYVAARDRRMLAHLLDPNGALPWSGLASLPLVLPGKEHGLRIAIEEGAALQGIALNVRIEMDAPEQLKEMVRRTECFTILSLAALQNDGSNEPLFIARITKPAIERVICLARAQDRPLSHSARRVEVFLKSLIDEELDKGWWKSALNMGSADS